MMKAYRVSFFKALSDSTGHTFHAIQGTVEVRATGQKDAATKARKAFAALKGANDWSFHADYGTVQAISASSAIQFGSRSAPSVDGREMGEVA